MNKKQKNTEKKMEENFIGEISAQNFEKNLDRLEQVVRLLEKGDAPLEESMALFREGAELIGACEKMLDEAEQIVSSVDISSKNGQSEQVLDIFDVDEDLAEMLFDSDDDEY